MSDEQPAGSCVLEKKTAALFERTAVVFGRSFASDEAYGGLAGAAGRAAGTLLHACKHEALSFYKIDSGRVQHVVRTLFEKELEPVLLKGDVALYCCFGYVHSQ